MGELLTLYHTMQCMAYMGRWEKHCTIHRDGRESWCTRRRRKPTLALSRPVTPLFLNPSLSISPFLPPSSLSSPPSASSSISQPGNQIELISLSSCFHDARHIMIYAVPHIALLYCFFVSCYAAAVQRGALAQPIQLGLLVAEEKLFRRHTSSFKGDIKDVPKIRKTIKIIFSNYSADTPWLYGGFPLFTCSLKHLSIAYWPILESAWKFISTTAWCKTLGRPTHRNWAVWGCFSHGRRWSPSCTGSPMRHGPDPGIGKV